MVNQSSRRNPIQRAISSVIESLEQRQLLTISLNSGVLSVVGTSGSDSITISRTSNTVKASLNGTVKTYANSSVISVAVSALDGQDWITINSSILQQTTIDGGASSLDRVHITGTTGSNTLNLTKDTLSGNTKIAFSASSPTVTVSNCEIRSIDGRSGNDIVSVGSGITASFLNVQALQSLTLEPTAHVELTPGSSSVVKLLSAPTLGSGAFIDVNDNALIITYTGTSPFNDLRSHMQTGLVLLGGDQSQGVGSGIADSESLPGSFLTIVDNGAIGNAIETLPSYGSVPENSIIITYAWFGDANLDGAVNGDDYALTDTGFFDPQDQSWVFGDFDLNTIVNEGDYGLIDTGFIAYIPNSMSIYAPAPSNIRAVALSGGTEAQISWTPPSGTVSEYSIWASADGESYALVGTAAGTATSYKMTAPFSGIAQFKVSAQIGTLTSAARDAVNASDGAITELALHRLADIPSNVQVSDITSTSAILHWIDNSEFDYSYTLKYSINGSSFADYPGTIPANDGTGPVSYALSGLVAGSIYLFQIYSQLTTDEVVASAPVSFDTSLSSGVILSIVGPDSLSQGSVANFSVYDSASGSVEYIWTATLNSKVVANGEGVNFSFTTSQAGSYLVKVNAISAQLGIRTSRTRIQSNEPIGLKQAKLNGSRHPYVGRLALFRVTGFDENLLNPQPIPEDYSLSIEWTVRDASGDLVQLPRNNILKRSPDDPDHPLPALNSLNMFSFQPPDVGTYYIQAIVKDRNNQEKYHAEMTTEAIPFTSDEYLKRMTDFEIDKSGYSPLSIETIYGMIEQDDGSILVLGKGNAISEFNYIDGFISESSKLYSELPSGSTILARYKPDLTLDSSFGNNGFTIVSEVYVDNSEIFFTKLLQAKDGSITVVDEEMNGNLNVYKYDRHGFLDLTFDEDGMRAFIPDQNDIQQGDGSVRNIIVAVDAALQDDGKLVILANVDKDIRPGDNDPISGNRGEYCFYRLNQDVTIDSTFGTNGSGYAFVRTDNDDSLDSEMILKSGYQILLTENRILAIGGGGIHRENTSPAWFQNIPNVVAVGVNGETDNNFGMNELPGNPPDITGVSHHHLLDVLDHATNVRGIIDSQGRLVTVGSIGGTDLFIARYLSNGQLDTSFGDKPDPLIDIRLGYSVILGEFNNPLPTDIALTGDDQIVISGIEIAGVDVSDPYRGFVARFTDTGQIDIGFGDSGKKIIGDQLHSNDPNDFRGYWLRVLVTKNQDVVLGGFGKRIASNDITTDGFTMARYRPVDIRATQLTATATPNNTINLRWVDAGTSEDGFIIRRATSEADLNLDSSSYSYTPANTVQWVDQNVLPDTTYYYMVIPFDTNEITNAPRLGTPSNVSNATTAPANSRYALIDTVGVPIDGTDGSSTVTLKPGSTYLLKASGNVRIAHYEIGTTWDEDAEYGVWDTDKPNTRDMSWWTGSAFDYGISVRTDGDVPFPVSNKGVVWGNPSTDANHTYQILYTVPNIGDERQLKLNFIDDFYGDNLIPAGDGRYSPLKVEIYEPLPSAPISLLATPVRNKRRVILNWENSSNTDVRVVVERSTGNGDFSKIAELAGDSTEYVDEGRSFNIKYGYRIRAVSELGESQDSIKTYVILTNEAPEFDDLPAQIARINEEYRVALIAEDPDGDSIDSYSIISGPPGAVIDNDGQISGWTPSSSHGTPAVSDAGKSFWFKVQIKDQWNTTTEKQFVVSVAPQLASIPTVTTAAHIVSQTDTTVTLGVLGFDDGGESNLKYRWEAVKRPATAGVPTFSDNNSNTSKITTATFRASGEYIFNVTISDGTDWSATSAVNVTVLQKLTSVQPKPAIHELTLNTTRQFDTTIFDQFGKSWNASSPTPTLSWSILGAVHYGTITTGGLYEAPVTLPGGGDEDSVTDVLNVIATVGGTSVNSQAAAARVWKATNIDPDIQFVDGNPINFSQLRLTSKTIDPDSEESDLIYSWQVTRWPTDYPEADKTHVIFSDNNTNTAKSCIFTCNEQYGLGFDFLLTVTDNRDGQDGMYLYLSDSRVLNKISLTPSASTINVSSSKTFRAIAEDQYGRRLVAQPTFDWYVGSTLQADHGSTFDYISSNQEGNYTVTVCQQGEDPEIPSTIKSVTTIEVVGQRPPIMLIASPAPEASGEIPLISEDTPVSIVVDDPNDDLVTWYLWARSESGARTLIASGNKEVGVAPFQPVDAAVIHPTNLANGLYTLELTETDITSETPKDVKKIEVRSELKLGNFTLPVTDLQVDVPGGTPISVTRTYDSSRANEPGKFGYGWQYEISQKAITTNALPSNRYPNINTLRSGDVVRIKLPGGGERAFMFMPKSTGTGGGIGQFSYTVNFVPIDGGFGTLVINDGAAPVIYSTGGGEFTNGAGGSPFNPDDHYYLKDIDGTKYEFAADTGELEKSTDSNGNVTNYNGVNQSTTNQILHLDIVETGGKIQSAAVQDSLNQDVGGRIYYNYDLEGRLESVEGRDGTAIEYKYTDSTNKYYLTKVVDARGVEIAAVKYSAGSGLVDMVTDAIGNKAPVTTGGFDGNQSTQKITDLAGNEIETIYNAQGDVIREIKAIKDVNGNVLKYVVTVHDYSYGAWSGSTVSEMSKWGVTNYNHLLNSKEYLPVEISGADPTGKRYKDATSLELTVLHETNYRILSLQDPGNLNSLFLPEWEDILASNGETHRTSFSDYFKGKPQKIEDEFHGTTTWMKYDTDGRLVWSANELGEGAENVYSNPTDNPTIPVGLLLATYKISISGTVGLSSTPDRLNPSTPEISNEYYSATNIGSGAVKGLLHKSTNLSGVTTIYTYEPDGVTKTVARQWPGLSVPIVDTTNEYDDARRLKKSTDSKGKYTQTIYNSIGQVDKTIDQFGGETANNYDPRGQTIRTVYPDGTESRSFFDSMGRVTWQTDRYHTNATSTSAPTNTIQSKLTHTIYDTLGRVIKTEQYSSGIIVINTAGVAPEAMEPKFYGIKPISTTSTVYDQQGRVVETVDTTGLRSGTVYYDNGQIRFSGPLKTDAPGNWFATAQNPPQFYLDPTRKTEYTYEIVSDLTGTAYQFYDTVTDPKGNLTKTYKDAYGKAVRTVYDDDSYTESFTGITDNAVVPPLGVDIDMPTSGEGWADVPLGGRHEVSTEQRKLSDPVVATHRLYDASGRLTDVWLPAVLDSKVGSPTEGQTIRPHWHYTYDANGNELTQQLVNVTGHTTSFGYNNLNQRTSRTMPADSNVGSDIESWTYDDFGRMQTHTDFKGQVTTYIYDDDTSLPTAEQTNLGRLVKELRTDGTLTENTHYYYDTLGRQSRVDEYEGVTLKRHTTYAYDPITGGVTQVSNNEGAINHAYDPATGRLIRTWTDNNDTEYRYDTFGRLWKVLARKLNGTDYSTPLVTTYAYDDAGNLDLTSFDNGTSASTDDLTHDYAYDDLNRLDTLDVKKSTTSIFSQNYDYQNNGQKDKVTETRSSVTTVTDWTYDGLNRLTDEVYDSPDNSKDYAAHFTFDLASNRHTKAQTGANAASSGYNYNDRDELTSETTDGATTSYTYDANGSTDTVTTGTNVKKYVWDLRNRLSGIDTNNDGDLTDTGDVSYTYDHNGVRVVKKVNGVVRSFVNDDLNPTGYTKPIEELLDGAVNTSYVIGLSVLGQADSTHAYLAFIQDGRGYTRGVRNLSGVNLNTENYDYDAYGNLLNTGITPLTVWQAPDGYFDFETGATEQLARYSNRQNGTWWTEDSTIFGAGEYQDANLHLYVGGSPIIQSDPSGNITLIEQENNTGIQTTLRSRSFTSVPRVSFNNSASLSATTPFFLLLFASPVLYFYFSTPRGMLPKPGQLPKYSQGADLTKMQQETTNNPSYTYFVSGAASGYIPDPSKDTSDFGAGRYTFRATPTGFISANIWAKEKARDEGGEGYIILFRIETTDWQSLYFSPKTLDYNSPSFSANKIQWSTAVNYYRQPNAAPGGPHDPYDVMIGPTATGGRGKPWSPVLNRPDQYVFSYPYGARKLQAVMITPAE